MGYRDIVVYLDVGADCPARVRTAINVAAKHQARLIGVDISTKEALEGESRDSAMAIEAKFTTAVQEAGLDFQYHRARPEAHTAVLFAHCADLLVTTQPHPDRRHLSNSAVPQEILMTAGVPMLVLPTGWAGEGAIGERVIVAWNFSRESTRAVHDAMPILKLARKVFLFVFASNYSDQNEDVQEIKSHLEHHAVTVALEGWRDTGETDFTGALFAVLDRESADLIVCGAYGHSPLFEDMFGGATRNLLNNISMPVLMSH
ncbi:nucleotide-binding universal stress UspA family protein [Sinorhizobium fredii]|uniref:UspA domain protein n=1 Tax=Sinorhizobium fredii (strain USDA 257) TaxID=1185652 RepID=I3X5V4_SINF2|nr:universal stress protein [Sinorhizobium fredii]AFL51260.1 UspA domain protein [Sinorhizobium fredii USDA 257]